jgi:hypothetical protein
MSIKGIRNYTHSEHRQKLSKKRMSIKGIGNDRDVGARSLMLMCLLLSIVACADSSNERGPYLQSPTPTSIVVKWRNGGNTTGKVSYGTVKGQLFEEVERKTGSLDHEVLIENLLPDTVYYYRVNGANESEFSFRTPPEEGVLDRLASGYWVMREPQTQTQVA